MKSLNSLTKVFPITIITVLTVLLASCDILGHVEANVPEDKNFESFLVRDLTAFFATNKDKKVTVEFELLRKAATQVGVAYPKYYAWVKVSENGKLTKQGAVRIAAIEKTGFEVTHFVKDDEIRAEPKMIESIFPAPLCPKILELAK